MRYIKEIKDYLTKQSDVRKKVRSYFLDRITLLLRGKKPLSHQYPYELLDPFIIYGDVSGFARLYLVGDNWKNKSDPKPIALMVGFNDWKFGFTSDYLPEYRTVFSPRKHVGMGLVKAIYSLVEKPSVIIVWGFTDGYFLRKYALKNNIPIYRMEDGFVRSSALGASHATPYSICLDKTGLYYDSTQPSDIETILNTWPFDKDPDLLKKAEGVLNTISELKISKYNPARFSANTTIHSIKTTKRVAVLGQVYSDAAIRYGNPDGWSTEELIQLARLENPDAEVLFRPHPETYDGYKKNKIKRKKVECFAQIISPEEPIIDFLETVDHVYTINSLSGLEALIRGIKVTVVGAAFYAGWGLTDDRTEMPRRDATRTLLELVAGVYLIYPRYLADLNNSERGLKAACLKIKADYEYNLFEKSRLLALTNIENLAMKSRSMFWPQLFFVDNLEGAVKDGLVDKINFSKMIDNNPGRLYQTVFMFSMAGAIESSQARDIFLTKTRDYIDKDIYNDLLLALNDFHPGDYVHRQLSWLLGQNEEYSQSVDLIASRTTIMEEPMEQSEDNPEPPEYPVLPRKLVNDESARVLLQLHDTHKEYKNYGEAIEAAKQLFISGHASTVLFMKMAQLAELTFDTNSAVQIASFLQKIAFMAHNRGGLHIELENAPTELSEENIDYLMERLVLQLKTNPDRINKSWAVFKKYFNNPEYYNVLRAILRLDNDQSIHKALAYLEIDELARAKSTMETIIKTGELSDKIYVTYSKILSTMGENERALSLIKKSVHQQYTHDNVTELLRLLKGLGRFEEAMSYARKARIKKIDITDEGHIMPIHFGLQQIEEGYRCFLDTALRNKLIRYYGADKYNQTGSLSAHNLLIIFSSGPAEEIRFASMYQEMTKALGASNFKLTCDYRLLDLFERTFPDIHFIPVRRTRFFTPQYPREDYNLLPGNDLINALDNRGHQAVGEADQIILFTDYIWQFRKQYSSFPGKPYLKYDHAKTDRLKQQLPKNTLLVGLCWRSFLSNAMRNVHYLTIQEIEPIFKIPGITFVSLQYDDASEEVSWINARYPGKLIDLDNIDQFNDFDSVASLMKCLDYVVTPNSVVSDLAGSLGCSGFIFSTHAEMHWRRIDESGTDVWFHSMRHINADFGNNELLVSKIVNQLSQLARQAHQSRSEQLAEIIE
ncbi:capsular polysaccharide export protein, LipB/KpsS family [Legionella sp. CNM-4043-24]|uniref:capsular polysaccharide export protein, LipB/KpsS family n=1 Tax=Legionella sp. CNM-4043-24 TaxID=3421646 RepID=UPI00403AF916